MRIDAAACILAALGILLLPLNWILAGLIAAGVHELCHLLAVVAMGGRIWEFRLCAGGAVMEATPMSTGRELLCELADVASFREENADMIRQQYEAGILKEYNYLPDSEPSFLEQALPWLLVGAGLILLWGIMAKRANSAGNMAGFGKARANVGTSNHKVTFDDVAGAKEEKEELEEIVDFLKNPEKY